MTPDDQSLDDEAFTSLLARMGEGRKGHAAETQPTLRSLRRRDAGFERHPLYQQMQFQRGFAGFAGLASPYYRLHDVRAGATSVIEGRPVINFASYDYLGLNGHPDIADAVNRAVEEYGSSVSASRITAGERRVHRDLEMALADVYGADDCIAFVSGHAAAVSTIATLLGQKDLIVFDSLSHNCIVVGAQLAGCARRSYPHNDLNALEVMLTKERRLYDRVLIVSEGLFSMDGDGPDLDRLIAIRDDFDAWLMIDDAHGLGVLGQTGRGIFEHAGVDPQKVDIWLGTLSKSLVSCGGYVAGCAALVDLLKHHAPGFVYSVGMPAVNAAAAVKAIEIMRAEPQRVAELQARSRRFAGQARAAGIDIGNSWGYGIIPIMVGETIPTVVLADRLLQRGVNAFPIVPPGVPEKSARLRFFVNASHTDEQIDQSVELLREELHRLGDQSLGSLLHG